MSTPADAVIIGGGYYGCYTALTIKKLRPSARVVVLEKAPALFTRASSTNQGQLHMGYLYSAFPGLAKECAKGAQEFETAFGPAVNRQTDTYYAIHRDSEISPADYQAFAQKTGLFCEAVNGPAPDIFGTPLAAVFKTVEKTFSNQRLQALLLAELKRQGIEVRTNCTVTKVSHQNNTLVLAGGSEAIEASQVYNATFADSNQLHAALGIAALPLQHVVMLHFGIRLPVEFERLAVSVVRGAFATFSPDLDAPDITHVLASGKYRSIQSAAGQAPSEALPAAKVEQLFRSAITEALPYLPLLGKAKYIRPIVGTRTNYIDPVSGIAASKAVVLPDYDGLKGYHVVFGGKVGCLFEIVEPITLINRQFMA